MPRSRAASTSSTEPGLEIGGFRLERLIGCGRESAVYQATQLNLHRRVAFKMLGGGARLERRLAGLRWPEHPNVVALYAAGSFEGGYFIAMQLVAGTTLAELHADGRLSARRRHRVLAQVGAALDAAHAAGIAHGSLHERNVLVTAADHAMVTDFGLAGTAATPAEDRAALAAMRDRLGTGRRPRARWTLAALAAIAAGVLVVSGKSGDPRPPRVPQRSDGLIAVGSALRASPARTVDCEGRPASGASLPCTIVATRIGGRSPAAERSGVVRRWSVRGARGEVALQVVRRRGNAYAAIARGPYEQVPDADTHTFAVNLPIRRGDLLGLDVGPGAAIGIAANAPDSTTARWFGPLALSARPVEHEPGAAWKIAGALTGAAARRAPAGQLVATRDLQAPGRRVQTLKLVRVGQRVAVDLLERDRRVARMPVQEAASAGRLLSMTVLGRPILRLRWGNPGGRVVAHDYAIGQRSIRPRS
jgi:serine/threonine protein kinase